ncbi:hypothetical protein KKG65_01245 [Patescibacteria group bacterium]|nr:hypothetical protein [Patescibacteria group bacterium]MBU1200522.1 hypothetical protein [Patescibacteria group bacterium]
MNNINNTYLTIEKALLTASQDVLLGIVNFIPVLLSAVLVFVFGIFVARWVKIGVVKLLNLARLADIISTPAVKKFLKNASITKKIDDVLGEIFRYIVLLIFFVTGVNLLGLSTVTQVLNGVLAYLPQVFAAILILISGILLAGFLEKVVKGSLGSIDLRSSRLMGKFTSYLIMVITVLAAISQLGIAQPFVGTIFIGFVAMLSLALGLGFGLGSKDLIKQVLEDWHKNFRKDTK